MNIKVYHTGRLDPATLADMVDKEHAIHCDCGWRNWEMPVFAEYGRNYVLEIDGEFGGSAQLVRGWDEPGTAYLAGFGISPDKQKQGYGGAFIKEIITMAAGDGFTAMELSVKPGNDPALKIYEDVGFKVMERHENRYGPGEDRLIMRLEING